MFSVNLAIFLLHIIPVAYSALFLQSPVILVDRDDNDMEQYYNMENENSRFQISHICGMNK